MATQGQFQVQQQQRGPVPVAAEYNADEEGPVLNVQPGVSLINKMFVYSKNKNENFNQCDIKVDSTCLLAFTGCCDSHQLTIGPYCMSHNHKLFDRTFARTHTNGGNIVVPIPIQRANGIPFMLVTSMIQLSPKLEDLIQLLHTSEGGMTTDERNKIIKFFYILLHEENTIENNEAFTQFQAYLLETKQKFMKVIQSYDTMINSIIIPVLITESSADKMRSNKWFMDILKKADDHIIRTTPCDDNKIIYHIPLTEFNIIDILTILSYHIDVKINQHGYAPTVQIINGQFIHGIGFGLNSTASDYMETTQGTEFHAYTKQQSDLIINNIKFYVANIDIETISAEPIDALSSTTVPVRLSLNFRTVVESKFNNIHGCNVIETIR